MGERRNRTRYCMVMAFVMLCLIGCGKQTEEEPAETVAFQEIAPQSEPVIIRDENQQTGQSTEEETQSETETQTEEIIPYADRTEVSYNLESVSYEEGVVKITYPQLVGMENSEVQDRLNENIRQIAMQGSDAEGLTVYELYYETATAGKGIVSVIFRGYADCEGVAHPTNMVKTLNLDLTNGINLRLKDYADIAELVSGLETSSGYHVAADGVDPADFSAFLNNGYVTDYAITILDYDYDFNNLSLVPAGYSCIRNNHVVLFIEAEHAMGDYVEIEFDEDL